MDFFKNMQQQNINLKIYIYIFTKELLMRIISRVYCRRTNFLGFVGKNHRNNKTEIKIIVFKQNVKYLLHTFRHKILKICSCYFILLALRKKVFLKNKRFVEPLKKYFLKKMLFKHCL